MNGIVTYDDGAGTTISGGVVTASALSTQNITAPNPSAPSGIYVNNSNTITIGNPYTPVYVERPCASANEVANKAYVDAQTDRKSTRLHSSQITTSYAVFRLNKKIQLNHRHK